MPYRPKLRPDHALLVAGAHPAAAMLVVKMTVHLDPPELIVHSLRQAQHLRHSAVDGIWEFIRAAGDRAPAKVGRKHARRIRTGISDSATGRNRPAKVSAGRCSGGPAPGLSCLWLPDPTGIDCPSGPLLHHRCALKNGSAKAPARRQPGTCSGDVAVCRDVRNVSRTRSLYERARHLPGTDHRPSSLSSTSQSGVASVSSRP